MLAVTENFKEKQKQGYGYIALLLLRRKVSANIYYAALAQLAEHLIRNQRIAGSIPAGGSTNRRTYVSHMSFFYCQ